MVLPLPVQNAKKTIYYDGSCPMCTNFIARIDASEEKERFAPKDIKREPLPKLFTQEQVEKEMHVIDTDGRVYKNADAILKILEEYPRWRILTVIGGWPIIRQLLPFGYNFIAANRHFLFGSASRIYWLKVVVVSGLIASLLLSVRLWTAGRFFPHVPVFKNLPAIPPSLETALFILTIGLLTLVLVSSRPRRYIFCALTLLAFFALFDQMRWQPWFTLYFCLLILLGLFTWQFRDTEKRLAVLNTSRLVVASVYFYSGLQKVNLVFMSVVFPWMVEPFAKFFPGPLHVLPILLGVAIPFLEMGIGVGLLTRRFRSAAMLLAMGMLGFVLLTLGPFGHNWNSVVWPWNIAMALFVIILFWRTEDFSFRDTFEVKHFPFQKVLFVFFVILPMLSFFNLWDSYPSSELYSEDNSQSPLFISDAVRQQLPDTAQPHVIRTGTDKYVLDYYHWSFSELNVPIYPEPRVLKGIARGVCAYASDPADVVLVVQGEQTPFNRDASSTYRCFNL